VSQSAERVYGTCVALGGEAAILKGASGSGKSDLALRFVLGTPVELGPALVADDQIDVEAKDGRLIASAPATIGGQIEVRGVGIVGLTRCEQARVRLIVQLVDSDDIPRLPPSPLPTETICGIALPVLSLSPFEPSAHLKLRLALQMPGW
jgi:serine kinase of HPr protein (carbohydrate metabolism regulator)